MNYQVYQEERNIEKINKLLLSNISLVSKESL